MIKLSFLENIPIWELPTDYFMHNLQSDTDVESDTLKPLTEWVNRFVMKHLPYSTCDGNRIVDELIRVHSRDLEMIDFYSSYHIPYKWTSFEENIAFQISLLARCFTPTFRTDFSPFVPATRRREGRGILKNPSLTGQSSTGSTNSTSSSDDDSSSDDESFLDNNSTQQSISIAPDDNEPYSMHISYHSIFPSMNEVYQTNIKQPNRLDMMKYRKYAKMGSVLMSNAGMKTYNPKKPLQNQQKRVVQLDALAHYRCDYKQCEPPRVDSTSIDIYKNYINIPEKVYNRSPSTNDLDIISKYFSSFQ